MVEALAATWPPSIGDGDLPSSRGSGIGQATDGPLAVGAAPSWPAHFAVAIPGGRVAGYFGSVITPDDALLAEASFGFVDDPRHHPIRRQRRLGPVEHLSGTAATVAYGHADAYFHWLFDVLPRIELLRLAGWDTTTWDHLIVSGSEARYERETLAALGIDGRILYVDDHPHVQADQLVTTSTVCISGFVPAWAVRFVRDRLLPTEITDGPPVRLYISRDDAVQRRLAEEDKLVPRLEALGFRCLTLADLPLDEQIELFARAEIVIGPHGGGLSNVVWCRPGTAVVELYGSDYVNPVFWGLSNSLDLRHYHVIGPPATPGLPRGYGAMAVDQDAIVRLAEHALAEAH